MDRRAFLRGGLRSGAALGLLVSGPVVGWPSSAMGLPTPTPSPGAGPYGSLNGRKPDINGLVLPEGFTARIVAEGGAFVMNGLAGEDFAWPLFPDGKGTLPTGDGGWLLVCNHEVFDFQTPSGPLGGASSIGFDANGVITGSWPVLAQSHSNSRGAVTPWGTWLSCQEAFNGDGRIWECDPAGDQPAVPRDVLGVRTHGSVSVDAANGYAYLTEAHRDGRLYRVAMATVGDPLSGGGLDADRMEALAVDPEGAIRWLPVFDPSGSFIPTRFQADEGLVTPMGGGVAVHDGILVFTTGLDDRVHAVDLAAGYHSVVWDGSGRRSPLHGIGDLAVAKSGDLFVSEERGDMELVVITPLGEVAPFCRMVGDAHRLSSVTGPCFDPSGTRLYVSSLRGRGEGLVHDVVSDLDWGSGVEGRHVGVTYEITGPFRQTAPLVEAVEATVTEQTLVVPHSVPSTTTSSVSSDKTVPPVAAITRAGAGSSPGSTIGINAATSSVSESGNSAVPLGLGLGAAISLAIGGAAMAIRRRSDGHEENSS